MDKYFALKRKKAKMSNVKSASNANRPSVYPHNLHNRITKIIQLHFTCVFIREMRLDNFLYAYASLNISEEHRFLHNA